MFVLFSSSSCVKEEEDHQRSSAPARLKQRNKKRIVALLPAVDWKKVIEKFSSSSERKENSASTRAREEGNARKREQKQYSYRHLDSPGRLAADFHVEKDNWVRHYVSKVFRA